MEITHDDKVEGISTGKKIDFLAVPVDTIITSPCPAVQIYQLLTLLVHDQQLKQTKLSQTI